MTDRDLGHDSTLHLTSKMKQHIVLLSSLLGLAFCGDLNNEYLPPNTGARSFGQNFGSTYSPFARSSNFGSGFGTSRLPSSQYGVPSTSSLSHQSFGGQYSTSQYSRPAAPSQLYGAPSQYSGTSTFGTGSSSHFGVPQSQYGAPSYSGQYSNGVRSFPSQFGRGFGLSSQHGAPQYNQYAQNGLPSSTFRSGAQFGGISSTHGGISSGFRQAIPFSGTLQDSNGGYIY